MGEKGRLQYGIFTLHPCQTLVFPNINLQSFSNDKLVICINNKTEINSMKLKLNIQAINFATYGKYLFCFWATSSFFELPKIDLRFLFKFRETRPWRFWTSSLTRLKRISVTILGNFTNNVIEGIKTINNIS